MIDPTKININELPKKFCDGAFGTYGKEFFAVTLTSGNALDSFAITPHIMKSISEWMSEQVASYEKQFGKIDLSPTEIVSPIQINDFKGGESK